MPADSFKSVEYMPSDTELDPGPSGVVEVPILEEELVEAHKVAEEHDMPALFEEQKAPSAKNEVYVLIIFLELYASHVLYPLPFSEQLNY